MSELYLELPGSEREDDAKSYLKEFVESGSDINGMGFLDEYEDYGEWLKMVEDYRNDTNLKEGYVGSTEYFLIRRSDDRIVGMVNIRHSLNEFLKETGFGHIGYGIRPSERRKGYATEQLRLALEKCRELGIKQVHVGCFEENTGSRRTIEKNGGKLLIKKETHGKPLLEFVIDNE